MFASMCGKVECVKILLEMGAQANTQNEVSSSTPVQCLLLMYVLVVYMWTGRVICEWNIVFCIMAVMFTYMYASVDKKLNNTA